MKLTQSQIDIMLEKSNSEIWIELRSHFIRANSRQPTDEEMQRIFTEYLSEQIDRSKLSKNRVIK